MPTLNKPKQGEDVRVLHCNVKQLVEGINSLSTMTATWDGSTKGTGTLAIKGDKSELLITTQGEGEGGVTRSPTHVVLASNINPSRPGETVTFAAGVQLPIAGTITFYIDNVVYATVVLSPFTGVAYAPGINSLTSGDHTIAAYYTGNHPPGIAYLTQHVNDKIDPSMVFLIAPNPAGNHSQVEFLVELPADTTGTVTFYLDGFSLGAVNVVSGVALLLSTSGLMTPGTHSTQAYYSGDVRYKDKLVSGANLVIASQSGVYVEVISSNNPAATTESIQWGAKVYPDPSTPTVWPTGTVQFYIEGAGWGAPAGLVPQPSQGYSFAASVVTPAPNPLDVGDSEIRAVYSGDTNYYSSLGEMTQIVLVVTDISVDCVDDEPIVGQVSQLICHVPRVEGFAGATGNVNFFVSGAFKDFGTLHGTQPPEPPGMAKTETDRMVLFNSSGTVSIRADYEGDGTYAGVFEQHNIHVYALATGFTFDYFGYITSSYETIAIAWYFNLLTPGTERSTPVQIRVLQSLWSPYPNPIYTGGYPAPVYWNASTWTPKNPNASVAEMFITAPGSQGRSGTNMQALLEVGFGDGHTAANLIGTPANTGLWLLSGPSRLIATVSFR